MIAAAAPGLHELAYGCLMAADPAAKVAATFAAAAAFAAHRNEPGFADAAGAPSPVPIPAPGRPPRPRLVHPRDLAQRKPTSPEGRAALVHAVAHIELNAIDLAWDAVYRFRDLPTEFAADWVGVAADEARHFVMLRDRLASLGHAYGDFDAHNGLWDMAVKTADDCLARMALVPRVLEARGLDVTPGMIARLRAAGDGETVAILEVILREEVGHVAAGSRWFRWCCARAGVEPDATFRALVAEFAPGILKGPFNLEARTRAGFAPEELATLGETTRPAVRSGTKFGA